MGSKTQNNLVMLVFVDKHTELHTPKEAMKLCSDIVGAGYIVDALTDDVWLQNKLRAKMERAGDVATGDA